MSPAHGGWLACALAALCACGGGSGPTPTIPRSSVPKASSPRAPTSTNALLSLAPPGADLLVELDLERVRDNPVVGEVFTAAVATDSSVALTRADRVLIASYGLGREDARTLTLLSGEDVPIPGPLGLRIDETTVAFGPPEVIRGIADEPGAPSVADDAELIGLRDWAMPKGARDAAVRVTARLDFEARVELAALLELDAVPGALSVWGDVIDDLALVGLLSGDDENDAEDLISELQDARARLASEPLVRSLRLSYLLRDLTVERRGKMVRAVFVVGPRRLQLVSRRLARALRDSGPGEPEPDAPTEPAAPTTESL